jgi:hypothetical protein
MIRQIDASSWGEFPEWLEGLDEERSRRKLATGLHVSELLFRGHASADWKLETTLERYQGASLQAAEYYNAVFAAKHQIETYVQREWEIPTPPDYQQWLALTKALGLFEIPAYEYLVYLRHHGFPSPLLDWSESPYVAAHFAFADATSPTGRVAIYAFIDYAGHARGSSRSSPTIHVRGPHVRGQRRHFLQQSQYTICTQYIEGSWNYASHEAAFENNSDDQDLLWKITFPASERLRALKHLDKFNLNAFSLLGSEESLMHTMAMRLLAATAPGSDPRNHLISQ